MSVKGVDNVLRNLESLKQNLGEGLTKALMVGGQVIRTDAVKSIQDLSQGKRVKRYKKGRKAYDHIAAASGEAPNTDTGALARSINVIPKSDGVYVSTSLEYAKALELGTSKMQARPFLLPAKLRSEKKIIKLISDSVRRKTK